MKAPSPPVIIRGLRAIPRTVAMMGLLAASWGLVGCGGGNGSYSPPATTPPPPPPPTATITGVVAVGDPLASATITAKAQNGTAKPAVSGSDGTFTLDVSGLSGPFLLQAVSSDGRTTLYSDAVSSGTTNIHPFTDLLLRAYYEALGTTADAVFAAVNGNSLIPGNVDLHNLSVTLDSALGPVLLVVGESDVTAYDMFGTAFRADGTGFDQLLHGTSVAGSSFQTSVGTLSETGTIMGTGNTIAFTSQVIDSASHAQSSAHASVVIAATTQQQQADEVAAISAINTLWTNMLSVAASKGSALQATDLAPFMDTNFLDRGRNSAFFGNQLALLLSQFTQSHTASLVPGAQVFAFAEPQGGPTTITAEVDLSLKDSANNTFTFPAFKYEDNIFNADGRPGLTYIKESDGSYKLYGDQSIAYTSLYAGSYDTYAASGATPGSQLGLSTYAPFASLPSLAAPAGIGTVASVTASSEAGLLPTCTGTPPYPLAETSLPLPEALNAAGAALTLNGTELFLACPLQVVGISATPPAGTAYTVTYTTPASTQSEISAVIHTQTSEIPHLSMIGGQAPAAFFGAQHIADLVGHTLTVAWSLPTTFTINSLALDCNVIDGLGNQFLLSPTFLPPTETTGTTATIPALLPSTNLPTATAACFVNFVGVNGELLTDYIVIQ